jgi:hypothetical protein
MRAFPIDGHRRHGMAAMRPGIHRARRLIVSERNPFHVDHVSNFTAGLPPARTRRNGSVLCAATAAGEPSAVDTLSHALWGGGLFGYRGHIWLALLFGALPDFPSFGIFLTLSVIDGSFTFGPPPLEIIPDWVMVNYDISHSLFTAFAVIVPVALWRRDIAFAMLAWPAHILLDVPFHSGDYFPTKLFWPLSDFYVDGFAWNTPLIWLSNLAGLALLYWWRFRNGTARG